MVDRTFQSLYISLIDLLGIKKSLTSKLEASGPSYWAWSLFVYMNSLSSRF